MRALSRQKRIAIELILARHGGKPSSARPSAAGSTSSDCAGLPGSRGCRNHVVGHHRSSPVPGGQCVSLSFVPGAMAASADTGSELGKLSTINGCSGGPSVAGHFSYLVLGSCFRNMNPAQVAVARDLYAHERVKGMLVDTFVAMTHDGAVDIL